MNGVSTKRSMSRYAAFTTALMSINNTAHPPGLDAYSSRRFAIYRNNTHRALSEALSAAYPVVCQLVGNEFFHAVAREYFTNESKRAPCLSLYGEGFAEHLAKFPSIQALPYLVDVARLERGWLEAMHARDAIPLNASALQAYAQYLADMRFRPHPATRLIASTHPIVSIWRANTTGASATGTVEIVNKPEMALITRPLLEVQVLPLESSAGLFTESLLSGHSVAEAFEKAQYDDEKNVTDMFSTLLSTGVFEALIPPGEKYA